MPFIISASKNYVCLIMGNHRIAQESIFITCYLVWSWFMPRHEECDTNFGLDQHDATLCEADLCLCRQEKCGTNFGFDEEHDSTLCEAELCLRRQEECGTSFGLDEKCNGTLWGADLCLCRQEECGTSFGLDEKCDATLCEADLCLSRQEAYGTNLGLDEESNSTLCEADLCLRRQEEHDICEEFRKQTDYISIVFIHTESARGRARSSVSTICFWIMDSKWIFVCIVIQNPRNTLKF